MTKQEVKMHQSYKEKDPSYPKLPKFILKEEKTTKQNAGHHAACLRGFHSRLKNWEQAQLAREMASFR